MFWEWAPPTLDIILAATDLSLDDTSSGQNLGPLEGGKKKCQFRKRAKINNFFDN